MGGVLLAPITALVSRIRHARMFHPDGIVYGARVEELNPRDDKVASDLRRVASRLAGDAIVRFSSAWWRGDKEWIDALGMAVRFQETPSRRAQDLLLATIRFPWTTPFAPLTTNVFSFLWNHFHAVSPFVVDGVKSRVKIRIRSPRIDNASPETRRAEHLAETVARGEAIYVIEARRLSRNPFRRTWEPFARLTIEGAPITELDQQALRFSPFHDGRGIHPSGFVHYLRVASYAASQRARSRSQHSDRPLPRTRDAALAT